MNIKDNIHNKDKKRKKQQQQNEGHRVNHKKEEFSSP